MPENVVATNNLIGCRIAAKLINANGLIYISCSIHFKILLSIVSISHAILSHNQAYRYTLMILLLY